ncbi:MAG: hypothetical protein R2710_04225 [Acidimicrobiales bacterium]
MIRLDGPGRRLHAADEPSALMQFAYMGGFVVTPALLEKRYGWTVGGIALLMAPRPGAFSASAVFGGYLPQRIGSVCRSSSGRCSWWRRWQRSLPQRR